MAKVTPRGISFVMLAEPTARQTLLKVRAAMRHIPAPYQIIVTGDGDVTAVRDFAAAHPEVTVSMHPNVSAGTAINRVVRKATYDCIVLAHNNVTFHYQSRGLIKRLADRARQDGVGATGCLLIDKPTGTIAHAGVYKLEDEAFQPLYNQHALKLVVRKLGTRTYPYNPGKSRPVLAVAGILCVSKPSWRAAKGLLETTGLDLNQCLVFLCLKLNGLKRQTWYVAGASAVWQNGGMQLQPPRQPLVTLGSITDTFSELAPAPRIIRLSPFTRLKRLLWR